MEHTHYTLVGPVVLMGYELTILKYLHMHINAEQINEWKAYDRSQVYHS